MAGADTRMASPARRRLLAALCGCALATGAWPRQPDDAVVVEGQAFARRSRVAGRELQLNGTGVRAVSWLKAYAAGLYLPGTCATAAQVQAMAGPKRLQLRLLQTLPAAEFAKAFRKGMVRNADADEMARLSGRVAAFAALVEALGTVRRGDSVDLDFDPGRGTVLSLNGRPQGAAIRGEDFYAGLLRSFVGERPYDAKLKAGLLGAAG